MERIRGRDRGRMTMQNPKITYFFLGLQPKEPMGAVLTLPVKGSALGGLNWRWSLDQGNSQGEGASKDECQVLHSGLFV